MTEYAIRVENLTQVYPGKPPVVANDDLSFEVPRGEIFGLLGPNGAGKTTLILQLIGLLKPTDGQIWLEGIDVIRNPAQVRHRIGFLPQTGLPMRNVEVERALYFTGRLRGQTHHDAKQQTNQLLDTLISTDYAKRYVSELSGGMLRLVNFAMSLMGQPDILVLDEPTNELDPQHRRKVWNMITRLNREQGVTCILVTHNLLEAERVVQRVAIMRQARFVALGTPGEMKLGASGNVRIEFQLKSGEPLAHDLEARLGSCGQLATVRPGSYTLILPPADVGHTTDIIINQISLSNLEDFRVAPPSLEDIYLELEPS